MSSLSIYAGPTALQQIRREGLKADQFKVLVGASGGPKWFVLYGLDHLFFAMAIAIKTYFQKIADPADIAATSSISFTINHIAAVILPALLGLLWVVNHSAVFLAGAAIALGSLVLTQLIPDHPRPSFETRLNSQQLT